MAGYQHTLLLHVLIAVIGIGPLAAVAFLAIRSPMSSHTAAALNGIRRITGIAMGLMLLTGLYLLHVTGWGYVSSAWLWIAVLLYVLLEPLQMMMVRTWKDGAADASAAGKIRMFGWLMLIFLVSIVVLMYLRP